MLSTREFLLQASQSELSLLTTVAKSLAESEPSEPLAAERADTCIDQLVAFMQRENITLQFAEDNQYQQRLLDLLINAVLNSIETERFNQSLEDWAEDYREFIAADREAARAQFIAQPPGILRTLMKGEDADDVFGDDYDALLLLKGKIIRHADQIKPDVFNVLAPVSLDTPNHLWSVIDDMLRGNEDKTFGLLVLANCGQNHWRVVAVRIQDSKVANVTLWDPLSGDAEELRATAAYQHLQTAINNLNGDNSVVPEVVMQGVQNNGHSCMDRGVQKILQLVGEKSEMTREQSDDELRQAVEAAVCENHAELFAKSEDEVSESSVVEDVTEEDFFEEVTEEEATAEVAHQLVTLDYTNTKCDEQLHMLLAAREHQDTQIQFDEMMARRLQGSLDKLTEGDTKVAEKPLFEEARNYAYSEMLKHFGVKLAKPALGASATPAIALPVLVK